MVWPNKCMSLDVAILLVFIQHDTHHLIIILIVSLHEFIVRLVHVLNGQRALQETALIEVLLVPIAEKHDAKQTIQTGVPDKILFKDVSYLVSRWHHHLQLVELPEQITEFILVMLPQPDEAIDKLFERLGIQR